ncbi:MAG TPA: cytosine permease [Thermoplasmata archaeon]|nr:cytosine permease [Thermoplasmata archaeon]
MVRLRRPPEWGVEPVPESLRVLRTFDLFVLWSSLGVGLLVLAAGALLVTLFGLTLWETILVSLIGSIAGSVLLAGAGHHGSRAGVPTMVSLRPILGRVGSYAPTALNIVQLLGWTAFELLIMGEAAALLSRNALGPWTAAIFVPVWGAITAALALGGPLAVIRDWLERFAIWLVYASTAAIAVALFLHGLDLGARPVATASGFPETSTLLMGVDLVVAMPISWWPLISDYNRFARKPRVAAVGTGLGYAVANTLFFVLGAGLVFLGITAFGLNPADPTAFLAAIGLLGLGVLPLVVILVDETDNAFADVYSVAVSVQNLAPRRRQAATVVVATAIGTASAWFLLATGQGLGGAYGGFLLLIGGLFVPLLGVVIADSFVVRRGAYAPADFFEAAPRWRWPAFASWGPGVVLYFGILLFAIPIGATLPSFALAAALHVAFSRLEAGRTRRPSVVAGDP